jgi:hypothetical protein
MKKFLLTTGIVLCLLILSNGILAQTTITKLDQLKLMQAFLGKWQATTGKDTVEVWDFQNYGKAIIINVHRVIKDVKTPYYKNNIAFDPKEGKFKGFALWTDAGYVTWIASFTSEKLLSGDMVQNFTPGTSFIKFENVLVNPNEWTWTQFNKDGVKVLEYKFSKIK